MNLKQFTGILLLSTSWQVLAFDSGKFGGLIDEIEKQNLAPVESFLETNRKTLEQDADYYVILLAYAMAKGTRSGIIIAKGESEPGDLSLKDLKTGETVGFLGERGNYDKKLITDAINRTRAALKFFPSRMEIHFGIVAVADKLEDWKLVGDQLTETLRISKEIDNKWVWGTIKPVPEDPEDFMIQNVLFHTSRLFHAENPVADETLLRVSRSMIKYYPALLYGYSNIGILHLAKQEYDEAEKYLNMAHAINPNDEIVKENLELLKKSRESTNSPKK